MKDLETVIIRGGGDLATGIGHRLYKSGFKIVVLETDQPLAIRRKVSFCEAVYSGEIVVEGVKAVLANTASDIYSIVESGNIPLYVDPKGEIIQELKPLAVVDAIMAKKNLGTTRDLAPITIGIGPGFEAGKDVDLVVETKRGHFLGMVIHRGGAEKDTGIPGSTLGYREERIVRALSDGIVSHFSKIGQRVNTGDLICRTGDEEVRANISGIVRGLIKEGLYVNKGLKIGDIDPRAIEEYAFTISEKARAVGGGVLESIMYLRKERNI
ncbi:MAG: selenium-dependent molybdenum cofactor biosynthesis protein YqeB [Tissierellaceae bacterium]